MKTPEANWEAKVEGEVLHIIGITKFPNQFSTARLERVADSAPHCISYRVTFGRDKEPFCDVNLIGPVHHFERHLPSGIQKIRIYTAEGAEEIRIRNEK